jgi:hypothetical protein
MLTPYGKWDNYESRGVSRTKEDQSDAWVAAQNLALERRNCDGGIARVLQALEALADQQQRLQATTFALLHVLHHRHSF